MSQVTFAIFGGLVLDLMVGELPDAFHPVRLFGRVVEGTNRNWKRPRLIGAVLAVGLPVAAAATIGFGVFAVTGRDEMAGVALASLAVFVTTSYKSLLENGWRVDQLANRDLSAARHELSALAGRDADGLDPRDVRSAVLESLAENLADGLVAPLFAFTLAGAMARIGGLPPATTLGLAVAAAAWIKAINTMDSMWGYPDRPIGTAAARLDDIVMWIPARLTAFLLAAVLLQPRTLARTRTWTTGVASPNAGWPMGALAAGLDVRLEKPGHYVLNPGGAKPTGGHVEQALRYGSIAGLAAYALAGVLAGC